MKIRFNKYNWTSNCYSPSLRKSWGGKVWTFSIYKWGIVIDLRKGSFIDLMLTPKEKQGFIERWFAKRN